MWIKIHPASERESPQEGQQAESIDIYRDLTKLMGWHGFPGGLVAANTGLRVIGLLRTAPSSKFQTLKQDPTGSPKRSLHGSGQAVSMASEVYQASPIKRKRRTKQELQIILDASRAILTEEEGAITIRHLFYRLVSQKLMAKEEREYDKLITYLMKWRRSGEIHWSAFADNTRYYYGTRGYLSMNDALQDLMDSYKRNLWASQDAFVEIWCEKDAIVSIISSVAGQFGVRTFPLHGFSSATALYSAAEMFKDASRSGKEIYIYYFGDYDPSGVHIDRCAIRNLREDHGVEPIFQRVAITPEQIARYDLTTRPSKKTDSRSKNFKGESVEIDAMPMGVLRSMVEECITQHIDPVVWRRELEIERSEKMGLSGLLGAV